MTSQIWRQTAKLPRMIERDVMEYDALVVGAGPAGLAAAIRLKQLDPARSVCVLEKAASIGGHTLSGAVMEPGPLDALWPAVAAEHAGVVRAGGAG